jgi:uncharacterized phage protein (TIGR02218 family)
MPSSLIAFLQNPAYRSVLKQDLFAITLPTGTTIYTTEGQWDITVPSGTPGWSGSTTTFHSTTYGVWNRGAITSEAGFNMDANSMTLTCVPQPGTAYPNLSVGLLNAALNGLFDASSVTVYTTYNPIGNYGNVSQGLETKFQGTITKINNINRIKVEFDCGDPMYLLNMKIPTRTFQPDCPWSVTDGNCGLSASGKDTNGYYMTQAFTAASGSTQWILEPTTAFSQPNGYFTQGVVTCTAGNNKGLSQTCKLHASGSLWMMNPFLLSVNSGDTFSALVGCDKTLSTCQTKFANSLQFGGTPFTPPSSTSV